MPASLEMSWTISSVTFRFQKLARRGAVDYSILILKIIKAHAILYMTQFVVIMQLVHNLYYNEGI